jgi:hypothetical protein
MTTCAASGGNGLIEGQFRETATCYGTGHGDRRASRPTAGPTSRTVALPGGRTGCGGGWVPGRATQVAGGLSAGSVWASFASRCGPYRSWSPPRQRPRCCRPTNAHRHEAGCRSQIRDGDAQTAPPPVARAARSSSQQTGDRDVGRGHIRYAERSRTDQAHPGACCNDFSSGAHRAENSV